MSDDYLKLRAELIMFAVNDYLDTCGFSFIHLWKTLELLKDHREIYEYKIEKLEDRVKLDIRLSCLASQIVEPPYYSVLDRGIEFNFWR